MNRLVKVAQSFRGFELESIFIADDEIWQRIVEWTEAGKTLWLGEVAGKHSDVRLTLKLSDFAIVSEDQDFISRFDQIVGGNIGIYLPAYMTQYCDDCGEERQDCTCC